MSLVPAKCTNCGGNLEVDNTSVTAICPYCGTIYIVEQAINNYITTYNTTNHISADVINIFSGNSSDFVIRAGTLEKYVGASTEVIIPDNVKTIGCEAFSGCRDLTSVVIPNGVTTIVSPSQRPPVSDNFNYAYHGKGAFSGCINLTKVTIPGSVKFIGDLAFSNCGKLTNVVLEEGIQNIGIGAFFNTSITSITIPLSVESIGALAFSWCSKLKDVHILGNPSLGGTPHFDDYGDMDYVEHDVFSLSSSEMTIEASENWKRSHWDFADCLKEYKPTPPPQPSSNSKSTHKSSGGCYIATAVYGSYDCPEVWVLRRFRDNTLAETWYGRAFIRCYYALSPSFVQRFGHSRWFTNIGKKVLDNMVANLAKKGLENTPYTDKHWS